MSVCLFRLSFELMEKKLSVKPEKTFLFLSAAYVTCDDVMCSVSEVVMQPFWTTEVFYFSDIWLSLSKLDKISARISFGYITRYKIISNALE